MLQQSLGISAHLDRDNRRRLGNIYNRCDALNNLEKILYKSIMGEQKPLKIFTKGKDPNTTWTKRSSIEANALVKCSLFQSSYLPRPQDTRLLPRLALAALDIYLLVKVQAPTG